MTQPVDTSPPALAKRLLAIISNDTERYEKIDNYIDGNHEPPYMPIGADAEYQLLAKRAVSNWMPLLIDTPAQALYVDGFRRGVDPEDDGDDDINGPDPDHDGVKVTENYDDNGFGSLPEWAHWQLSRLDSRQIAIHRGALKFGHSFAVTEMGRRGKAITRGLSSKLTAALYEDPANDIEPYAALTITRVPGNDQLGQAKLWDRANVYLVTFKSLADMDSVQVGRGVPHGASSCPVTRFAAYVDLEGRTSGVIERYIPVQDRINQTMFDLLVAQTYGSFQVRTVTGMAPPVQRYLEDDPANGVSKGDPILDGQGNPIPQPINLNARRFMFAEDPDVKFGTMPGTPLAGYIASLDMSIRQLASMTQTPPHYLLGQIANLSAEALQAAEATMLRKVEEFKKSFGESWERVFRVAAELNGDELLVQDYQGEVIWRDTEMRSLSGTADALVKLKSIGVPEVGLWPRIPKTTRTEIEEWMRLRDLQLVELRKENPDLVAAALASRTGASESVQVRIMTGDALPSNYSDSGGQSSSDSQPSASSPSK